MPVRPQVSESGKALLDVLQRCPATDTEDSATQPDFATATHGIMGVLHQVMQVHYSLLTGRHADRQVDCFKGPSFSCRVTMRWRGRGSIVNSASTSVCSCVCFNRTLDRYDRQGDCHHDNNNFFPPMPVSPHLSAFSPSVSQVLDWVEQHGEVFLNKHSGVGKSLHRARALQKRHDDFQQVAQVSHLGLTEPDWVVCVDYGFTVS